MTAPEPAPDARELARELADRFRVSLDGKHGQAIQQVLATAYRAGIEAAARVASRQLVILDVSPSKIAVVTDAIARLPDEWP